MLSSTCAYASNYPSDNVFTVSTGSLVGGNSFIGNYIGVRPVICLRFNTLAHISGNTIVSGD